MTIKLLSKTVTAILLGITALSLTACGGDDDGETVSSGNANANNTDKSAYALRLEVPRVQSGNNYQLIVKYDDDIGVNYIVEWDKLKRAQRWTCWQWTKANNFKNWLRQNWNTGVTWNGQTWHGDPFHEASEIEADYRSLLSDYKNSGYDRGHICASEDRICSMNVNGQTFCLANMQPQINSFNARVWSNMETKVRNWSKTTTDNNGVLYVCKGGTINDVNLNGKSQSGTITMIKNRIPVPKYFFMAVLKQTKDNTYSAVAFWAEHKSDNSSDLTPYMISIDELEARTGYDFFCNLPDNIENTVESRLNTSEWR
ncbi:MAG: DNA/RNA non-specific endonuclease [Bacteroidales bacterium]|nr:DNA/RNA non-specific endonuclease [Bacteroidales bacterium]MCM1148017.1 DNA/RNA non-specific endonuclease [Bacteroidales bacterium]MCM1206835.1 DNA/RNA non-specific endonuclease [Bacillota bacterium]MCM1511027.1 DNA/RNA non-specific endonuclease [Clostridium sp.]